MSGLFAIACKTRTIIFYFSLGGILCERLALEPNKFRVK